MLNGLHADTHFYLCFLKKSTAYIYIYIYIYTIQRTSASSPDSGKLAAFTGKTAEKTGIGKQYSIPTLSMHLRTVSTKKTRTPSINKTQEPIYYYYRNSTNNILGNILKVQIKNK